MGALVGCCGWAAGEWQRGGSGDEVERAGVGWVMRGNVERRLLELLVRRDSGASEQILTWLVDGDLPPSSGRDIAWLHVPTQ